jgi:hypothetical protein
MEFFFMLTALMALGAAYLYRWECRRDPSDG